MDYLKDFQIKLDALFNSIKEELGVLRTNRPTPKLVENISVNYLDQNMQIRQLGSITVELPRDLVISLWDKGAMPHVIKALEDANLGMGVSSYETSVRVKLPELTNERKEEIVKIIKSTTEETRIKMRIQRDEVNKRTNEEIDKDRKFKQKEELQKKVDKFNGSLDELVSNKIKEILNQ
ncbi:MAG: hypothetical protein A3E61_00690 [Candidatus Colwellbacteria bacterium RIFCSPHIGHO2_12_FULL_43_12]|uniref:Ribosome recycling factor domain-containing protein n=1 Tax=Candidatus Colwellbacteria bacterium RIFCSPHIGHO2_12_FULL_43_12 TaxID=1797688 RepID=A0A1G1Z2M3_9BACT|nr:MAG: hypothetical protein A3E61_00690 [Candidatus Colwellbacteria bacterium RIFCSPHIGHO2_12_FULL_43_12]